MKKPADIQEQFNLTRPAIPYWLPMHAVIADANKRSDGSQTPEYKGNVSDLSSSHSNDPKYRWPPFTYAQYERKENPAFELLDAALIEYENMLKKAYDLSAFNITNYKFKPYETFHQTARDSQLTKDEVSQMQRTKSEFKLRSRDSLASQLSETKSEPPRRRRKKDDDFTSYYNSSAPARSGSEISIISRDKCNHLRVRTQTDPKGECRFCGYMVPHYGSVLDTGTIRTYIKVIYKDESYAARPAPLPPVLPEEQKIEEVEKEDGDDVTELQKVIEQANGEGEGEGEEGGVEGAEEGGEEAQVEQPPPEPEPERPEWLWTPDEEIAMMTMEDIDVVGDDVSEDSQGNAKVRDYRMGIDESMIIPITIYESFTPTDTHQMREYMLYVINKNIRRMRKHRIITESIYERFEVLTREVTPSEKEAAREEKKGAQGNKDLVTDAKSINSELLEPPQTQCKEFKKFLKQKAKDHRLQDEEYLMFDSTIESGNLERVDAYPINHKIVDVQRASDGIVQHKYLLYCKVDTNTKGHQQWFYFRCKNTKINTRYHFSICNFTKPYSLYREGMKVQFLSKRQQAEYVISLQDQIDEYRAYKANPQTHPKVELTADAKLFMDKGIVKEQWKGVGIRIQYLKSKLEREGFNIPGPLNIDDEEDQNIELDDLNPPRQPEGEGEHPDARATIYKRCFFKMNFELEMPYENDTVYLAYSKPYQYTQVLTHMFNIEEKLRGMKQIEPPQETDTFEQRKTFTLRLIRRSFMYERTSMCKTICGLPVPKITITAHNRPESKSVLKLKHRNSIVVTSRVHPGETNASTVFAGFFSKLVENVEKSPILGTFIVLMVPCLNPDGVVCGNYRSSLAGVDLNRQWIHPNRDLHPEVFHTKREMHYITQVQQKKIVVFCDIHCHSKKRNSFLYGCNVAWEGASFSTWTQVRLLPRLLARRSLFIQLSSCKFGIDPFKLSTARVVVWKQFRVMNSFTLENSFLGYDHGPEVRHYTQEMYQDIGAVFFQTLNDYRVCIIQIQQELADNKGWLKPAKLKQISGTPAADILAEQLEKELRKKQKQKFVKKYDDRMQVVIPVAGTEAIKMRQKAVAEKKAAEKAAEEKQAKKEKKKKKDKDKDKDGKKGKKQKNNDLARSKSLDRKKRERERDREPESPLVTVSRVSQPQKGSSPNRRPQVRPRNSNDDIASVAGQLNLDTPINAINEAYMVQNEAQMTGIAAEVGPVMIVGQEQDGGQHIDLDHTLAGVDQSKAVYQLGQGTPVIPYTATSTPVPGSQPQTQLSQEEIIQHMVASGQLIDNNVVSGVKVTPSGVIQTYTNQSAQNTGQMGSDIVSQIPIQQIPRGTGGGNLNLSLGQKRPNDEVITNFVAHGQEAMRLNETDDNSPETQLLRYSDLDTRKNSQIAQTPNQIYPQGGSLVLKPISMARPADHPLGAGAALFIQESGIKSLQTVQEGNNQQQQIVKDSQSASEHDFYGMITFGELGSFDDQSIGSRVSQLYTNEVMTEPAGSPVGSPRSPNMIQNWRNLFGQEELNEAYRQSIVGFERAIETKDEYQRSAQQSALTLEIVSPRVSTQIRGTGLDDSDDEETYRDNFKTHELHQNVYMQDESQIREHIKRSTNAQQNFIQELKIMIKKRDTPEVKSRKKRKRIQDVDLLYEQTLEPPLVLKGVGIRKDSSQLKQEEEIANRRSPSMIHMVPQPLDDLIVGTKIDLQAGKQNAAEGGLSDRLHVTGITLSSNNKELGSGKPSKSAHRDSCSCEKPHQLPQSNSFDPYYETESSFEPTEGIKVSLKLRPNMETQSGFHLKKPTRDSKLDIKKKQKYLLQVKKTNKQKIGIKIEHLQIGEKEPIRHKSIMEDSDEDIESRPGSSALIDKQNKESTPDRTPELGRYQTPDLKLSNGRLSPSLLVGIEVKKAQLNPIAEVREPSKFSYTKKQLNVTKQSAPGSQNLDLYGFIIADSGPSTEVVSSAESVLKERKSGQGLEADVLPGPEDSAAIGAANMASDQADGDQRLANSTTGGQQSPLHKLAATQPALAIGGPEGQTRKVSGQDPLQKAEKQKHKGRKKIEVSGANSLDKLQPTATGVVLNQRTDERPNQNAMQQSAALASHEKFAAATVTTGGERGSYADNKTLKRASMTEHSQCSGDDLLSMQNTMQAVLQQAQILRKSKESGKVTLVKTRAMTRGQDPYQKKRATLSTPFHIEPNHDLTTAVGPDQRDAAKRLAETSKDKTAGKKISKHRPHALALQKKASENNLVSAKEVQTLTTSNSIEISLESSSVGSLDDLVKLKEPQARRKDKTALRASIKDAMDDSLDLKPNAGTTRRRKVSKLKKGPSLINLLDSEAENGQVSTIAADPKLALDPASVDTPDDLPRYLRTSESGVSLQPGDLLGPTPDPSPLLPHKNHFQMYVAMNMHNVDDEEVKKSYAEQIILQGQQRSFSSLYHKTPTNAAHAQEKVQAVLDPASLQHALAMNQSPNLSRVAASKDQTPRNSALRHAIGNAREKNRGFTAHKQALSLSVILDQSMGASGVKRTRDQGRSVHEIRGMVTPGGKSVASVERLRQLTKAQQPPPMDHLDMFASPDRANQLSRFAQAHRSNKASRMQMRQIAQSLNLERNALPSIARQMDDASQLQSAIKGNKYDPSDQLAANNMAGLSTNSYEEDGFEASLANVNILDAANGALSPTSLTRPRRKAAGAERHNNRDSRLFDASNLLGTEDAQPLSQRKMHDQRLRLKSLLQTSGDMIPLLSLQQSLATPVHHPSVSFEPSQHIMMSHTPTRRHLAGPAHLPPVSAALEHGKRKQTNYSHPPQVQLGAKLRQSAQVGGEGGADGGGTQASVLDEVMRSLRQKNQL